MFSLVGLQVPTYNPGMNEETRLRRALVHALTQIEIAERAIERQGFDAVPTVRELLAALADTIHEEIENAGN
jgi:hypothetical protein